jgi:hypothetical protein
MRKYLPTDKDLTLQEFLRHEAVGLPFIVEYMNFWFAQSSKIRAFYAIPYGLFRRNPTEAFQRFLEIVGVTPINEEALAQAISEADFEKMKEREKRGSVPDLRVATDAPEDERSFKVRRGVIGGYRDYFTEEDHIFADRYMEKLNPELRQMLLAAEA